MKRKYKIVDELNLVQMQIHRMANNSFIIKGWYIAFLTTFSIYIITQNKMNLILWGIIPILLCSLYDCKFLYLERLYCEKYHWIIENKKIDDYLFNLDPYEKGMQRKRISFLKTFFCETIIFFYFFPIICFIFIA